MDVFGDMSTQKRWFEELRGMVFAPSFFLCIVVIELYFIV